VDIATLPHPPRRVPFIGDVVGIKLGKPVQSILGQTRDLGPIYARKLLRTQIVTVCGADLVGELSFTLQWTVLDGGARRSRLAEARAGVRAAESQANLKRNQITDEVWTAYSNLTTAFRQRQTALALLQASTQSYNAALESYNNGVRNLLDVTAAQRTLAQARSADVSARTQILTSLADLAFTTGDSIRTNNARPQP